MTAADRRDAPIGQDIPRETLLGMYRTMQIIRRYEEVIADVYAEQEMRCPTHLSIGEEAPAAGVCAALRLEDHIYSNHRCHAHYLAKGGDPRRLLAELYGKKTGCAGGKGGSMHLIDEAAGMMGTSAIVGAALPVAAGSALGFQMQGEDRVSVAFFGDAGVEQGTFHETLNFAALRKLPVILVCENNLYATQTGLEKRQITRSIYRHGENYGIPGESLDGNDVLAIYRAAAEAVARARRGEGPTLLECHTYRWREHVGPNYDWDMGYRTKEEVEAWMAKCPVKTWRNRLLEAGITNEADLAATDEKIEADIKRDLELARNDPFPEAGEMYDNVI